MVPVTPLPGPGPMIVTAVDVAEGMKSHGFVVGNHRSPSNFKIIGHVKCKIIIFQGQFSTISAFSTENVGKSWHLNCSSHTVVDDRLDDLMVDHDVHRDSADPDRHHRRSARVCSLVLLLGMPKTCSLVCFIRNIDHAAACCLPQLKI